MNSKLEEQIQRGKETRKKIMDFIIVYIMIHRYSPSNVEIAEELNMSNSAVKRHIDKLFEQEALITDLKDKHNMPRAYRVSAKYLLIDSQCKRRYDE